MLIMAMFSGMPQKGYVCQCALGIKYVPDDVVMICVVNINFWEYLK